MATQHNARHNRRAGLTVAIVFTAYMAVVFGLGLYLFSLLASEMRQTLGFGTQAIGMITAAAQVSYLIAAGLCPMLTKRFGEMTVIVAAVIVAGVILTLVSTAGTTASMGALVGSLGACAAFMVIPTVGVISRTVAFEYRSQVNGLVSSGTAYGQFASGSLAPWLVLENGWRSAWLVFGAGSIAIALVGLLALRIFAPAAFGRTPEATAIKSQHTPLLNPTNLSVWTLLAASGMACGPWQNYLSTFLSVENGHSISVVGQLWSMIGFLGLFSGFAMGLLADKIGIKRTLSISYGLIALAAVLIALHSDTTLLYAAAICFGLSFFAVYGLIPAYITKTMDASETTAVFAGANICLGLGTAFGNLTSGYIPNLTGSLQHAYFGIAIIACAAAAFVGTLPKEPRRTDP
ncbi:MAG: MFS transporter [Pseudomonadota bacterium]